MKRKPSLVRSEVYEEPVCLPTSTRKPAPREPASVSVSTSRMRTFTEKSLLSAMVHSASVAPCSAAILMTRLASSSRSTCVKRSLPLSCDRS